MFINPTNREIAGLNTDLEGFADEINYYGDAFNGLMENVLKQESIFANNGIDPRTLGGFSDPAYYEAVFGDLLDQFAGTSRGGKALRTTGEVSFSDEDLRMLHDISRREYSFNYRQLTPQVSIVVDRIEETADIDALADRMARGVIEVAESRLDVGATW